MEDFNATHKAKAQDTGVAPVVPGGRRSAGEGRLWA
jgi:hypothetical protein